jgi:hypothetical protein
VIRRLHDFDNNTKLDGLEILQAIHHTVHSNEEESQNEDVLDPERQTATPAEHSNNADQDDFDYFVGKWRAIRN